MRNASAGKHNDSTELEVETDTQPLWVPHAFLFTGKEVGYDCPKHKKWIFLKKLDTYKHIFYHFLL